MVRWGAHTVPTRPRYDRQKLTLKDVHNCQYVACMNPTSGSFTIDPRLQVSRGQTFPSAPPGRGSSGPGLRVLGLGSVCSRKPPSLSLGKLKGAGRAGGHTIVLMTPEDCQIGTPVVPAPVIGKQEDRELEASLGFDAGPVPEHERLGL